MFRRRGGPTAAVAVGALLAFTPATRAVSPVRPLPAGPTSPERLHQDTLSDEARLLERLDTLRRRMATLRPLTEGPLALDTLVVRGLRVITPAEDAERYEVDRWLESAVHAIERHTGSLPLLADTPTLRVDWRPVTVGMASDTGWTRLFGPSRSFSSGRLADAVAQVLTARLPEPVRDWLDGPLAAPMRPYFGSSAFAELAWSPLWLDRACLAGDTDACTVALGLEPLDTLELAPRQREQVRAAFTGEEPPQRLSGGRVAFLSSGARRNLLHYLVRTRPDALARLLSPEWEVRNAGSSSDAKALLEAAAGARMDVVLGGWVEELRTHRRPRLPVSAVASSLIWVLLFAGLATRSTRWRAG